MNGDLFGVLLAVVLLALVTLPRWGDPSTMRILVEFIALLVLAQTWNLLAGYAGLVSIGQQAYVGLGGYALVVLADDLGVNPFAAVPLAGLVAAALALPTAALVFRFQGGYFAVGTWAIAEVYRLLIANTTALGRGSGRTLKAVFPLARESRAITTYLLALVIGLVAWNPFAGRRSAGNNPSPAEVTGLEPAGDFPVGGAIIRGIAFAPDGKSLFSAAVDGGVVQWDLATRKPLRKLAGTREQLNAVVVSGATVNVRPMANTSMPGSTAST